MRETLECKLPGIPQGKQGWGFRGSYPLNHICPYIGWGKDPPNPPLTAEAPNMPYKGGRSPNPSGHKGLSKPWGDPSFSFEFQNLSSCSPGHANVKSSFSLTLHRAKRIEFDQFIFWPEGETAQLPPGVKMTRSSNNWISAYSAQLYRGR